MEWENRVAIILALHHNTNILFSRLVLLFVVALSAIHSTSPGIPGNLVATSTVAKPPRSSFRKA
jgi:hypothetical protein